MVDFKLFAYVQNFLFFKVLFLSHLFLTKWIRLDRFQFFINLLDRTKKLLTSDFIKEKKNLRNWLTAVVRAEDLLLIAVWFSSICSYIFEFFVIFSSSKCCLKFLEDSLEEMGIFFSVSRCNFRLYESEKFSISFKTFTKSGVTLLSIDTIVIN